MALHRTHIHWPNKHGLTFTYMDNGTTPYGAPFFVEGDPPIPINYPLGTSGSTQKSTVLFQEEMTPKRTPAETPVASSFSVKRYPEHRDKQPGVGKNWYFYTDGDVYLGFSGLARNFRSQFNDAPIYWVFNKNVYVDGHSAHEETIFSTDRVIGCGVCNSDDGFKYLVVVTTTASYNHDHKIKLLKKRGSLTDVNASATVQTISHPTAPAGSYAINTIISNGYAFNQSGNEAKCLFYGGDGEDCRIATLSISAQGVASINYQGIPAELAHYTVDSTVVTGGTPEDLSIPLTEPQPPAGSRSYTANYSRSLNSIGAQKLVLAVDYDANGNECILAGDNQIITYSLSHVNQQDVSYHYENQGGVYWAVVEDSFTTSTVYTQTFTNTYDLTIGGVVVDSVVDTYTTVKDGDSLYNHERIEVIYFDSQHQIVIYDKYKADYETLTYYTNVIPADITWTSATPLTVTRKLYKGGTITVLDTFTTGTMQYPPQYIFETEYPVNQPAPTHIAYDDYGYRPKVFFHENCGTVVSLHGMILCVAKKYNNEYGYYFVGLDGVVGSLPTILQTPSNNVSITDLGLY